MNKRINLLPTGSRGDFWRWKKAAVLISSGSIVVLVLLAAFEYADSVLLTRKYNAVRAQNPQLVLWQERKRQLDELQQDFTKRHQLIVQIEAQRTPWLEIMQLFGYTAPEGLNIFDIKRGKTAATFVIRGRAENLTKITEFVRNLERTGAFKTVTLERLGQGSNANSYHDFTLGLNIVRIQDGQAKPKAE